MPTADKFTFIANDGLARIDISGYDDWITLSGFKKSDLPSTPTASEINESRRLAYKLYLLYYGLSCVALSEDTRYSTLTITDTNVVDDLSSGSEMIPQKRILGLSPWLGQISTYAFNGDITTSLSVTTTAIYPKRLYNGSINDESLFIGYGGLESEVSAGNNGAGGARLLLNSLILNKGSSTATVKYDYSYVILNQMHLICESRAAGTGTLTTTASSFYAEAENISTSPGYTAKVSATISAIDFYTLQ